MYKYTKIVYKYAYNEKYTNKAKCNIKSMKQFYINNSVQQI